MAGRREVDPAAFFPDAEMLTRVPETVERAVDRLMSATTGPNSPWAADPESSMIAPYYEDLLSWAREAFGAQSAQIRQMSQALLEYGHRAVAEDERAAGRYNNVTAGLPVARPGS